MNFVRASFYPTKVHEYRICFFSKILNYSWKVSEPWNNQLRRYSVEKNWKRDLKLSECFEKIHMYIFGKCHMYVIHIVICMTNFFSHFIYVTSQFFYIFCLEIFQTNIPSKLALHRMQPKSRMHRYILRVAFTPLRADRGGRWIGGQPRRNEQNDEASLPKPLNFGVNHKPKTQIDFGKPPVFKVISPWNSLGVNITLN